MVGRSRQAKRRIVLDPCKIQPGRRERRRTRAPITRLQHVVDPTVRTPSDTNVDECADNVSHHMVKKGIGADADTYQTSSSVNAQVLNLSNRCRRLAFCRAKRSEVMAPHQMRCSALHRLLIQRPKHPTCARMREWHSNRRIHDPIVVAAAACPVASVKVLAHRPRPLNRNRRGEKPIGPTHPSCQGSSRICVEVDNLIECVNTAIGSPRTNGGGRSTRDLRERILDCILHATSTGLRLPAGKSRAVVFNAERDAHREKLWAGVRRSTVLAFDLLDQINCCLALLARAIAHHFVKQLPRTILDA